MLTTGCNSSAEGIDLVVEGAAVCVVDSQALQELAAAWEAKYGPDWHFDVGDGVFLGQGETGAWVYRVAPVTAFGYGKGDVFSQTHWRF